MVYVVWVVHKNCHYVGLCSVFKRMAHGMFDTTLGPSTGWQMVLPSVHLVDVVPIIT
jgi:hypothetical protein